MTSPGWTADTIPDLTGLTAVVTGANSGLGFHTALELARYGATVVMACRDLRKGEAALARMKHELGRPALELRRLDLADLASVRAFAVEMRTAHPRLDILVNNAGIMAIPRHVTPDGFERQLGVNHLGHFALTGLLFSCLTRAGSSRVVTVTSASHSVGRIDFDDLMSERRYGRWRAYAQSKLANLLFAFELQRRAEHTGLDLVSAASHPGYAATNLQHPWSQTRPPGWLLRTAGDLAAQPAFAGALPSLYAATMPDVRSGDFFGPRWFGLRGSPTRVRAAARAYDSATAEALWKRSAELTGVDFAELG
ncbi:oxidoreductase [Actinopolymorpha sp. B17G11]|uniref:oxidoreductase n=1 Tax=Actinopolymorpha sp. B17G11 TaxID=3160861 RepID=UPI0032E3C7A7